MTYHARAIVLKREQWRETARLYTFYTRELGKVTAVGRGTRKLLSKLAAHLEPYSVTDLHLAHGRRIETVCGALLVRSPEPLAADDGRHLAASFIAESADHFIKPGERDAHMWDLLDRALGDVSACGVEAIPARLGGFVWRFMDHLGYRPKLDECMACGRFPSFGPVRFLPVRGLSACADCLVPERDLVGAETLPEEAARALREDPEEGSLRHPALRRSAYAFLEAHLDRPLATLGPVRQRFAGPVFEDMPAAVARLR